MKSNLKIRNGFFSKDCEFSYDSGYVTSVHRSHRQSASYNKSSKNIDIDDYYTTKIKMKDFETQKESLISFPFEIDFEQGEMATIFYVSSDKKGYRMPIGIYNHEKDDGYVDPEDRVYSGFRLLKAGKFKRSIAWLLKIIEHVLAFGLGYFASLMITREEGLSLLIALIFTKLIWYPVAFVTNLFLPSQYGAKKAYGKFEKEIIRIGKEEMAKSRNIKQKLDKLNDPLSILKAAGIDMGAPQHQTPSPQSQQSPPQNDGGFKPMF